MYQTAVPQQPVQCHCRAVYTRAQRLSPALRFQNSRLADHVQRSTAGRLRPLRASKDSKQSHNKPNPQVSTLKVDWQSHTQSQDTKQNTEFFCSNQRCTQSRFPQMKQLKQTRPCPQLRLSLMLGQYQCLHAQNLSQSLPPLCTALRPGYAYCSAPQAGSKAQPNAKAQKGSQASQAKGKPDYEMAGPLADWLKDAAAEMKKQGVNQKFTVSFAFVQHIVFNTLYL